MNEPYLTNIFGNENLYYDFSFLDYDDIPIVFVCHDLNKQFYLCDCTEIRQYQQWTIAKTDIVTIRKILVFEISIYDALKQNGETKCLIDYVYETDSYTTKQVRFEEIPDTRLPEKGHILKSIDPESKKEFEKLIGLISQPEHST